jgi:dipeptidyl-peptidase-4
MGQGGVLRYHPPVMMSARRLQFAVLVVALAPTPRAQQPVPLRLQDVLDRGPRLLPAEPVLHWASGHECFFVRTAADGNEAMFRLQAGAPAAEAVVDGRALLPRLGIQVPSTGPVSFPPWSTTSEGGLRFELETAVWHWAPGQEHATRVLTWPEGIDRRDGRRTLRLAPGDQRAAYVLRHDLHLAERSGQVRRITWDGNQDIVYGDAAHRAEFAIAHGLYFSPDGRWLAFYREDRRRIAPYPWQDLGAMPPAPRTGRYPMAGRTDAHVRVGVCDTTTGAVVWLEHPDEATDYWTNLTFGRDGQLFVAFVNRGQDQLELARFDGSTGKRTATLLREQDPQWIEPMHGPTLLADGRFLWWSARDGYRHLYLHDADGKPLVQVTKGAFDVQRLVGLAPAQDGLWFLAAGEDPRQRHLYFARIDGSEVRQVTRERGTHDAVLAPDGLFARDVWSNLETPPTARFLELGNGTVHALPDTPPASLQGFALPAQRPFQVKAEDDTVLYGHALLPAGLQEGRKHPALLWVYGGPQAQLVTDAWLAGAPPWLHALANEGYVVCWLDNRGTTNRGIEFEQAIHRRLGTIEAQDQLRAVEWLKQQPFVDPARIGVHGWSYGGYLTLRLLLLSPDVFACGISGAPVTDWNLYETGYTERYMDTPAENADGYRASSCLPLAAKLRARLLIAHGTDDRTVVPAHSLLFVDRCIEAGVLCSYLPYPNQAHRLDGAHEKHFLRALADFLARELRPGS